MLARLQRCVCGQDVMGALRRMMRMIGLRRPGIAVLCAGAVFCVLRTYMDTGSGHAWVALDEWRTLACAGAA